MVLRSILCLLVFAIPTVSQTLGRYSFRREVTIQTLKGNKVTSALVRKSFCTFNDSGQRVETEVQESGKSKLNLTDFDWRTFRDAQIITQWPPFTDHGNIWTNETLRATVWKCNPDIVDGDCGDQSFPILAYADGVLKGKRVRLTIRYSNYRLFRTSVVVREVSE